MGEGPQGEVELLVEPVQLGLEVPWGIAFVSGSPLEFLITERGGRISRWLDGVVSEVATIEVSLGGEGGLLGIALDPAFGSSGNFFVYHTAPAAGGGIQNQVVRYHMEADGSASLDKVIIDGIPANRFHNGGRLRIGPDDMLYVSAGDGQNLDNAQDLSSLGGKILRLTLDGDIPADNPIADSATFAFGFRNPQALAWLDADTLVVTDHGPTGELGRRGHDEVNIVKAGDNLGWSTLYGCQAGTASVAPAITWQDSLPPGGVAIYTGTSIPAWTGDVIVGVLGFGDKGHQLHRIELDDSDPHIVVAHEVYLKGDSLYPETLGRIRDVVMGPDGELYVTTSNCDGRGTCPADGDGVFRITAPPAP